ncbi:MAG: hypothetical protein ACXWMH_00015 [Syntrophales bacterium]
MADSTDNMNESTKALNAQGCARLFGTTAAEIERQCGDLLQKYDFRYRTVGGDAFKETLLKVIRTINESSLSVSGKGRHKDWETGIGENLRAFESGHYNLSELVPKYMYKFPVRRLFGEYIEPVDANFEVNFYTVYRQYLFKTYLDAYSSVFEFGCGTGYNLVIMEQLFPGKMLFGLDWARNSVKLVNTIAFALGIETMKGRLFDFFSPDDSLEIAGDAVVITLNSMEQLGGDYNDFLQFLLRKKPALCINSEPFLEMYDENNLLDYLAAMYHRKRNYLKGYLPALKELEKEGRIKILKEHRVHLGNMFHEGYSLVIWKTAC